MSKHANPANIGAFIVGAVALLVIGIIIFSSNKWFHETKKFVVYFDESINGLVVGAPVKLYGVQIGQVIDIKVERDVKLKQMLAPVIFEIEPTKIINYDDIVQDRDESVVLQELIHEGLRMQLQVNSLLTGRLFIEARFLPDTPVNLVRISRDGMQEIPSVPSSVQEIQNTVQQVLEDLQNIPLEQLFTELTDTVSSFHDIATSEQTQQTLTAFNKTIVDLQEITSKINQNSGQFGDELVSTLHKTNHLIATLDAQAGPILESTHATVNKANTSLVKLDATLAAVEKAGNEVEPVSQSLTRTLAELDKATRSFRQLMDYLQRHPEALLQGKPD